MPMPQVGVKELKNRATQIVRDVREHATSYVVTVDGQPVAILKPYTVDDAGAGPDRQADIEEWLRGWDELAVEIGKRWPHGLSAVNAVREQRRTL
jgi:prevent-host-death family protein